MFKLKRLSTFLFLLLFGFSAMAQCPNSLNGYTLMGEYGDSKYFLSNNMVNWNTAQSNAASAGGYLASITSQGENDFIFSNLNSIVFIGYNDAQSEGNFKWDSGESVGFDKFADTNTSSKDYGKMNNWNGNWGVDNQYVSRKYVVEIPCGNSGGGGFQVNCDLNIDPAQLTVVGTGDPSGNVVNWSAPTATTDCSGGVTVEQISGPISGTFLSAWFTYTVVYDITDACGNMETCIREIFIDGTYGDITCPADITIQATSSNGAIVNYNAPTVIQGTCTIGSPDLVSGSNTASGSQFPIGTTEVEFVAFANGSNTYCQTFRVCNFNVTVIDSPGGGGGCPDNISGFTALGEYGDSKYYLSNSSSQPAAAQATAESNGGYLAVIGSQGENDFIQQNINVMPYIGLNDVASEGNLKWVNGESLTYDNVDPCGFCEENSGSKDYVIMAPWNGKWSFSSQWNSRPYVMEIPCNGGGGNPDECSFDKTIPLGFSGFGAGITELKETNAGYVLAGGNQIAFGDPGVKVFEASLNKENGSTLSSGNAQSNADASFPFYYDRAENMVYEASIPSVPSNTVVLKKISGSNNVLWTKNLNAGFPIYGVSSIQKFDNEIIISGSSGPTSSFAVLKTNLNGNLSWAKNLSEGVEFGTSTIVLGESVNGGYYIQYTNGGPFVVKLNNSGNKLWKIDVGTGDPPSEKRYVIGESADGQYFYMANSSFNSFKASFTRFNTSNGNGVGKQLGEGLPTGTTLERSFFLGGIPTNDGGFVAFYGYAPEVFGSPTNYHDRFDASGNLVWRRETPSDIVVDPFSTKLLAAQDGGFILAENVSSAYRIVRMTSDGYFEPDCGGGGNNQPDLTVSNLTNLSNNVNSGDVEFFNFNLNNVGNATATNSYVIGAYISTDNNLSSNDILAGEVPTANTIVGTDPNVPGGITVPNVADGNYYLILKADINNSINESNENNNTISRAITIGPGSGGGSCNNPPTISGFTYKTSVGNKAYYLSNGTDRPTDAQNKCEQAGGNLATVSSSAIMDALKQHTNGLVYIGLHDENTEGTLEWRSGASIGSTYFDNCSICESNSGNKDYVAMQGWNGKWSWSGFYNSRKYWLEVDCNNLTSNNSSTLIALSTVEEKELLDFQKIVPNPATNHIFVQIKSETEIAIDVEVYDARGMLLKSQPTELFNGINAVEVDIADLPGGFYLVKIPQMKGQYAIKRFVKVRD